MAGFELKRKDSETSARLGVLSTAHGDVQTPVFMAVGTSGTVKGITTGQLRQAQVKIVQRILALAPLELAAQNLVEILDLKLHLAFHAD